MRWSALAVGVFYGFSHQRTITATQKAQHDQHEYEKKQKLIDQAKAEYAKKKNPAPAGGDDGMSCCGISSRSRSTIAVRPHTLYTQPANFTFVVITDASHPNFDLEKLLLKVAKENP